jgi:osmotically inducible protein OsmC
MLLRRAEAGWQGTVRSGQGQIALGSGAFTGPYSYRTRMQGGRETNPEELLGSALAACFTMSLAAQLGLVQHPPTSIQTSATVQLTVERDGYVIPQIELAVEAQIPGIDEESFQHIVQRARQHCPMEKALAGTNIQVRAVLSSATK